ncbi:MAG: DUF2800 domain-containing protein [Patescibacteria group bacterium]
MAGKAHSELSPSSAERWWNCPGSVALVRDIPQTESEYAKEGTAAHALLEKCLRDPENCNPFDMVDMEIEGVEVTDEMAEAVSYAIEVICEELQKGGDLYVEEKVTIIPKVIYGISDAIIVRAFDTVVVIDFKYGQGVIVSAVENHQLKQYALPKVEEYMATKAVLLIIQPRAKTEERFSRWEVSADELAVYKTELLRHIELTREKEAMLCPGDHCSKAFCAARATCPALRQNVSMALAPVQNRELVFPDVKILSTEVLVRILDAQDRIEDFLKAVSAYAYSILETGGTVPGYELGKKRANRRWIDEKKVADALRPEFGDKIFKEVELLTPAQMEKLVGKEKAKELAKLTEKPDNGLTLKKIGAKK